MLPDIGLDLIPCSPDSKGKCSCPRRSLPPEMPEFKEGATAEELKKIIMNHYASSAFNRCTHQTLSLMKGHPLPIITDPAVQLGKLSMLTSDIPSGTIKSVLDVWNSYHSVPVMKEDRDKLTFLTPWGRYRYCVAPQGYLASGDGYTQIFTKITKAIKNK